MLLLALLLGCSKQEPPCDSVAFICDTAAYAEKNNQGTTSVTIDPIDGTWIEIVRQPGCPADPDLFTVSVRVRGTPGTAYVNIWSEEDNGGFNETHPLTSQGDLGGTQDMVVELRDEALPNQLQPGESTTYICGEDDLNASLTYAVRIYDASGNLADCAALSAEGDSVAAIQAALSGNRDEPNPIPQREDLTIDNCEIWTLPGQ